MTTMNILSPIATVNMNSFWKHVSKMMLILTILLCASTVWALPTSDFRVHLNQKKVATATSIQFPQEIIEPQRQFGVIR